jgi:hypothetical protein
VSQLHPVRHQTLGFLHPRAQPSHIIFLYIRRCFLWQFCGSKTDLTLFNNKKKIVQFMLFSTKSDQKFDLDFVIFFTWPNFRDVSELDPYPSGSTYAYAPESSAFTKITLFLSRGFLAVLWIRSFLAGWIRFLTQQKNCAVYAIFN